jgi:GLPGLI family protein
MNRIKTTRVLLVAFGLLGILFLVTAFTSGSNEVQQRAFLYKVEFKKYINRPDITVTDYIQVNTKGNTNFTFFYNRMKRDSIESLRKISSQERYTLFVNDHPYSIKTVKNKAIFTAEVGDQYFSYEQTIDFKWKLTDTKRKIDSYNCKLATVSYAGRTWNAWYTMDLPMDVGPYKFKGLPGCIVEMSDVDGIFKYTLIQTKRKDNLRFEHYTNVLKSSIISTTHEEFNKYQQAYLSLSFDQRMAYLVRAQAGIMTSEFKSQDGQVDFKNKQFDEMDDSPFIEIDHID